MTFTMNFRSHLISGNNLKIDFILIKHNKAAETLTKGNIKKFLGTTLSKMYEKTPYLDEIRSNFVQCIKEKNQ